MLRRMAKAKSKAGTFDAIEPLPTDAWGLSRVKPGAASSETAAALLGLGYPNMFVPTSEPFSGTDDDLIARVRSRLIPRTTLEQLFALYMKPPPSAPDLATTAKHVIENGTSLIVWIVEAQHGSVATAEAFVSALAAYPVTDWFGDNALEKSAWSSLRGLAFTLWRIPADVRTRLRDKLAAIYEQVAAHDPQLWRPGKTLDVLVNGRAGVERNGRRVGDHLQLSELLHAADDPEWVAKQTIERLATLRAADREQFDIQLAVIGGPKVLAALRDSPTKFSSDQKKSIAMQLTLFA